jgi:hypothetical protein
MDPDQRCLLVDSDRSDLVAEMSTGATEEQIEDATRRCFEAESPLAHGASTWESVREWYRETRRKRMREAAHYLVRPEERIVPAFQARDGVTDIATAWAGIVDALDNRRPPFPPYVELIGQLVLSAGVPVSPVRSRREALVEAAQAVVEASIPIIGENAAHVPNAALTALESALAAIRATPEPERA